MRIKVKFWEDIIEITDKDKTLIIELRDLTIRETSKPELETSHELQTTLKSASTQED